MIVLSMAATLCKKYWIFVSKHLSWFWRWFVCLFLLRW